MPSLSPALATPAAICLRPPHEITIDPPFCSSRGEAAATVLYAAVQSMNAYVVRGLLACAEESGSTATLAAAQTETGESEL